VDSIEQTSSPETVAYGDLPELARGLRALGSTRAGGALQSQFFQPLLDARRRAADARTADARVTAFNAADLQRALEKLLDRIVAEWPDNRDSARRALRTELQERTSSYLGALGHLASRADDLRAADESIRLTAWRAWTVELVAVFAVADRTWLALRPVIEATRK
jgi:hypothetical protein